MNPRPCIRCQHPVLLEDGHLCYCSHCGAPQIFLSEELQDEIAEQARGYNERSAPPPPEAAASTTPVARRWLLPSRPGGEAALHPWPLAVQYALISAVLTLALGLLTLLLPSASLLLVFWIFCTPILTVGAFNARSGTGPQSPGFAARLGLLTSLLVSISCAVVFTLELLLARFVTHSAALLDSQLAASFDQQRALTVQRMGTSVQPMLTMFNIPEFRVGLVLSVLVSFALIYLLVSTVAAGLAGVVLQRRRGV